MATASEERRKHARYDNESLALRVHRPGIKGMLRLNPTAECLNFSLTGLQFGSEQRMTSGEKLVIDLCVGDIELFELPCEVRTCHREEVGFCCGIQFNLADKRMQRPEVLHSLLKIEDRLRSYRDYPTLT